MRPTYWIIGLATLSIVIGMFMSQDPERAGRLSQMYRDAAFTGEARQMVIMGLALAIGAFVVYLSMTRR
ncbi:hypothetical protein JKG68_20620 [Microvirga aerilata]|jgi:UPF0716 family protein affecting phage T7 exclusion|uniref:DUF3185 family protein n=1 Tax=Microvirga aerilata TaxID=670292 RepID=A0A937D1Y1_9HYPH|nr:hypothetical protein [Microvirga aerilata]MBL0406367.1 hypothetical protein [Microvirga aerilata]